MIRAVTITSVLVPAFANLQRQSLESVDSAAVCTDGSPASYYFKPAESDEPALSCDQCTSQGFGEDECDCGYCGSYGGCSFTCGESTLRPKWLQPPRGPKCSKSLDSNSSSSNSNSLPQSQNVWIVYLEGGGWCYDAESCESRCGTPSSPSTSSLCSSKKYGDTISAHGLFYPMNDDILMNANKAYVKYCTSDAHMGDGENFGFQFRGGVVVQSVLKDLVATHGLGSGAGRDLVIFGGGSAGGRGAMVHLDYVSEMLGSAASNVDVVGFLDSPAWVDVEPFSASFPGFPYIVQHVHSYANVDHLGSACVEAYPTEQWKCMYGQYRLPTITTPYFLVASQADEFQLRNNVGHKPSSSEEQSYAQNFAALTRDLVASVKVASPGNAVYSWQCYNHCVATQHSGFDQLTVNGNTMDEALQQFLGWLPETTSPALSWIDTCTDFACGSGCSALATDSSQIEGVMPLGVIV